MTKEEWMNQKWGYGMVGLDSVTGIEYPITGVDFENGLIELDGSDRQESPESEWSEKGWVQYSDVTITGGIPNPSE